MKRARLIIAEVNITKQGQMKHFQIKLPKDTTRIIAIETDARMNSKINVSATGVTIGFHHP